MFAQAGQEVVKKCDIMERAEGGESGSSTFSWVALNEFLDLCEPQFPPL